MLRFVHMHEFIPAKFTQWSDSTAKPLHASTSGLAEEGSIFHL